jgi:hypothetical protein
MYPNPRRSNIARASHGRLIVAMAAYASGMCLGWVSPPLTAVAPTPARADLQVRAGPVRNWAGYAVRPAEPVTRASARWTHPSALCGAEATYASIWVGVDGYGSDTVEQIGTEADCYGAGAPVHGAWYQLYPADAVEIDVTIAPGDRIDASVSRSGAAVTLRLVNGTSGERFVVRASVPGAAGASAEWIVEAPKTCGDASCPALPLTALTPVLFRDARLETRRFSALLSDRTPGSASLVGRGPGGTSEPSSARAGRFAVTWEPAGVPGDNP